jgi:hypothetical protein
MCYLQHFDRRFGQPFDRQTFHPDADSPPLQIVVYDQRGHIDPRYKGYRLFASIGLTAYEEVTRQLAEAILVADRAWKEIPLVLVNALFFITRNGIVLAPGFAIGGVDKLAPALAEKYDKSALYFNVVTPADGFDPGFETVQCGEDLGLLYQAVFISPAEHDFLRRQGVEAFEEKLLKQEAERRSLLRPPCV